MSSIFQALSENIDKIAAFIAHKGIIILFSIMAISSTIIIGFFYLFNLFQLMGITIMMILVAVFIVSWVYIVVVVFVVLSQKTTTAIEIANKKRRYKRLNKKEKQYLYNFGYSNLQILDETDPVVEKLSYQNLIRNIDQVAIVGNVDRYFEIDSETHKLVIEEAYTDK